MPTVRRYTPEISLFKIGHLPVITVRQGTPARAVIFHHGLDATKETDLRLLLAMAEAGFLVIAADGPGYGERAKPPRRPAMELIGRMFFESARDTLRINEWLKRQGYSEISMIGRSLGGIRALIAAGPLGRSLNRLALIVTGGDFPTLLARSKSSTLRDPDLQKRLKPELLERMGAFDPLRLAPMLPEKLPILLLAGARDEVVPVECSRALAGLLARRPQNRYIEYDDAGHALTDRMIDDTVAWFGVSR